MVGTSFEYCKACREVQRQTNATHDCAECESKCPDLMPENREALNIWLCTTTCWDATAFGVIGYKYERAFEIAERLGYDITPSIIRKMQALEKVDLERFRKGGDENGT
jgi:ribosomal protein L37AE/L43A